ncbi:hypothetical protein NM96_12005 [Neisseria mucosa]|uniref:hypothetical protein n=1 Tax=Neisseriaceae TaxID=481 RepID=UPI000D166C80|nr:hypothetical protein [Kingella oralis]AVR79943.1 hypothetical protein NM96_12005 [Neisseria mucosa]
MNKEEFENNFGCTRIDRSKISNIINQQKYTQLIALLNTSCCGWEIKKEKIKDIRERAIQERLIQPNEKLVKKSLEAIFQELKNELRTELDEQQKGKCFFCKTILHRNEHNSDRHLEHFKPKNIFPDKTVSDNNLILSCISCNFSKVGLYRDYENRWVHPYNDNYHEHIEIDYFILKPINNSEKAKNMISELCLNDYDKVANRFSNEKNHLERALKKTGIPQNNIDFIINKMDECYYSNLCYLKDSVEINQETEDCR